MKKAISILIMAVIGGGIIEFSSAHADNRLKEREVAFSQWLAEAQKISDRARDDDISSIVEFFRNYNFLVVPIANKRQLGIKIAENIGQKKFGFVVLLDGDQKISKSWREAAENNTASFVIQESQIPILVLKNNIPMSGIWKGLVLIHEGTHVLCQAGNAFADIPSGLERRATEEVYAYTYQRTAISALVGPKYKQMIQVEGKKLEQKYKEERFAPFPDYREARKLDAIFGKSLSRTERGIRWNVFWIHSVFQAIENIYGTGDRSFEEKVNFLSSAYKKRVI